MTMRLYYWPALNVDNEHAAQDETELEDFLHAPQNWTYDFGQRWLPVQVVARTCIQMYLHGYTQTLTHTHSCAYIHTYILT